MLLKNLHIVGKPVSPNGYQVRFEQGKISDVNISDNDEHPDQFKFDEEVIAFPGLINAHEHLAKNTHERLGMSLCEDYTAWAKSISKEVRNEMENIPFALRYKWGILKNTLHGFTTIILHDPYIGGFKSDLADIHTKSRVIHSLVYDKKWRIKVNWPESKWKVIHLAEGVSPLAENEPKKLLKWCLFPKKAIAVHGIKLQAKEASKLGGLIWCPNSNITLYGQTAAINILKNELPILFGTDSTISSDRNLLFHLKQARKLGLLSDRELFESVTSIPAGMFGYSDRGEILKGKVADLVIAGKKQKDLFNSFYDLDTKDVIMVIKSGKIVMFDESLKDQIGNEVIQTDFDPVLVGGVKKYIRYPAIRLGNEIKEYYPGLRTVF